MITFDLRQTLIPFSLLQIANAFRTMQPGDMMEITTDRNAAGADSIEDIMRILPPGAYDLVSKQNLAEEPPATRLRLRKRSISSTHQSKEKSSCPQSIRVR
jgi:TusA-related sulfurtransferase